jgi:hypothetical protein
VSISSKCFRQRSPILVFVFDLGFLYNSGVCVKMIGVGIEAFDGALDDVSEDGVPTPVDGVIGGRGRVVVAVVEGRAGNLREGVRREWCR